MYRAITWLALQRGISRGDEASLARMAAEARLDVAPADEGRGVKERIMIDGRDISNELRSPEIGEAVSHVSRVPGVRTAMVEQQRRLAKGGNIVMAGRDIGTVVLQEAPLKVYLDASVDERVRRRHQELLASGKDASETAVREELALRDAIDSTRDVSPLRPAQDAIMIHTDGMTLDQVVERILELACR
jgi:cytidylate kinase